MKAPDKIYLHKIRDEESSGFHKMWFEQRARCVPSEEYIRKDALIEWAKEHYTSLDITKRDMWDGGYNCAIKELIDKLNSM